MARHEFQNFKVDHMTMLVHPRLYNVTYLIFRIIFGCDPDHRIYEKRKEWVKGEGEKSLTYAMQIGQGQESSEALDNTMVAIVQPSEPDRQSSHVREMLDQHSAAAHWQHIALRTTDLLAFHDFAEKRAVNFITPILRDEADDVIQVFSGEWYIPGTTPSGMFFEFLQRNPSEDLLKKMAEHNRESWFNDKTFMGLYSEKETEYQKDKVVPFLDDDLFEDIFKTVKNKNLWEITESDVGKAEEIMMSYARKRPQGK
jgi:hypothetical protein